MRLNPLPWLHRLFKENQPPPMLYSDPVQHGYFNTRNVIEDPLVESVDGSSGWMWGEVMGYPHLKRWFIESRRCHGPENLPPLREFVRNIRFFSTTDQVNRAMILAVNDKAAFRAFYDSVCQLSNYFHFELRITVQYKHSIQTITPESDLYAIAYVQKQYIEGKLVERLTNRFFSHYELPALSKMAPHSRIVQSFSILLGGNGNVR